MIHTKALHEKCPATHQVVEMRCTERCSPEVWCNKQTREDSVLPEVWCNKQTREDSVLPEVRETNEVWPPDKSMNHLPALTF